MKNAHSYARVDIEATRPPAPPSGNTEEEPVRASRVRWWIIPLSVALCCAQVVCIILGDQVFDAFLVSTLIPVSGFAVLFLLVILINPLLAVVGRFIRGFQRLNRIELICLFSAMFVTSGLATFGLAAQVVPLIPAPWNPEWNTPQSGRPDALTHPQNPLLNPKLHITREDSLLLIREGLSLEAPAEGARLREMAGYYYTVLRTVPWSEWIGPLGYWLIFIFGCLAIFYSLGLIVLNYWADREKLIFPLAQLPEALLPSDSARTSIPGIFKRAGFWSGFLLSMAVLSWNASVAAGWILPDFRLFLGMAHNVFSALVEGGILEGLGGGGRGSMRFLILFTAIGIAFLLPTQVSFSSWFYFLMGQVMLLIAVWMGFGRNTLDFQSDFMITPSFLTAQGGGALLAFSAISLYRCLREYVILSAGKTAAERMRILAPLLWFAGSILVVFLWLLWNQIHFFWALAFLLVITLLTIGIMRIVAETGIYWAQLNFGFFHAFNAFGMAKFTPVSLVVPLMPLYAVFFMDIKTFVAPTLLNAAKLQKDNGACRRLFHVNLILCIVISALFAIAFLIFLTYERGAQQMNSWFFHALPSGMLNNMQRLMDWAPDTFAHNGIWVVIGAAWLCFSLRIRQSLFWFPHPIGYILLFNPLMSSIWFSFFIGWVCKKVVVKYGGRNTFDLVRPFFLGLIFGELMTIFVWMFLGFALGFAPAIDLNRTGP